MNTALVTVIFSVVSSILTSLFTYMFTRKKYAEEIKSTQIDSNTKQLEFYIRLVKDYKQQCEIYMKQSEETRLEVLRLRRVMSKMINDVCTAKGCNKRAYLSDVEITYLMEGDNYDAEIIENGKEE